MVGIVLNTNFYSLLSLSTLEIRLQNVSGFLGVPPWTLKVVPLGFGAPDREWNISDSLGMVGIVLPIKISVPV